MNLSQATPLITEAGLCAWVGQATPGDCIAYHRGFLACDIAPEMQTFPKARRVALARLAGRARSLANDGAVHLVQRREGPGDYTYLMIVRPRPRRPSSLALPQVLAAPGDDDAIGCSRLRPA